MCVVCCVCARACVSLRLPPHVPYSASPSCLDCPTMSMAERRLENFSCTWRAALVLFSCHFYSIACRVRVSLNGSANRQMANTNRRGQHASRGGPQRNQLHAPHPQHPTQRKRGTRPDATCLPPPPSQLSLSALLLTAAAHHQSKWDFVLYLGDNTLALSGLFNYNVDKRLCPESGGEVSPPFPLFFPLLCLFLCVRC